MLAVIGSTGTTGRELVGGPRSAGAVEKLIGRAPRNLHDFFSRYVMAFGGGRGAGF